MYGDFGISEAFSRADNILATAAKGIAEIITVPGYINVDFADVETVMRKSGLAVMGTGISSGEKRAEEAIEKALNSPLLNNNDIRGAKNILLNITSGTQEVTMDEVGQITDYVQNKAGFDADLIWGNGKDEALGENISVTIIATGFSASSVPKITGHNLSAEKEIHALNNSSNTSESYNEKKVTGKKDTFSPGQKTIEFNVSEEREKEESEFEMLYPKTNEKRSNSEKGSNPIDYSIMSDEDVDELENVPAYKRRNLRMNDPRYKKKFSNYSVTKDNKIADKNSYLHGQVD